MMKTLREMPWLQAFFCSFGGVSLGAVAAIVPLAVFLIATLPDQAPVRSLIQAFAVSVSAYPILLVANLVYGLPAYAWLRATQRDTWANCIIVGAMPGVVMLPFVYWQFAGYAIYCGVCVGATCHWLGTLRLGKVAGAAKG